MPTTRSRITVTTSGAGVASGKDEIKCYPIDNMCRFSRQIEIQDDVWGDMELTKSVWSEKTITRQELAAAVYAAVSLPRKHGPCLVSFGLVGSKLDFSTDLAIPTHNVAYVQRSYLSDTHACQPAQLQHAAVSCSIAGALKVLQHPLLFSVVQNWCLFHGSCSWLIV